LPRLNHDVTADGIRVCKGLPCGQTGHGTGSSSISVSMPSQLAGADDFAKEEPHDDHYDYRL
jgi:hypothetical protein